MNPAHLVRIPACDPGAAGGRSERQRRSPGARRGIRLALWAAVAVPSGLAAQEESEPVPQEPPSGLLSLGAAYTGDLVGGLRGGLERGARYLHNLDLTARLDLRGLGAPGTSLFLYVLGNHGGAPSTLAGDAQGVDNIEAPSGWRLYEAWVQRRLGDDRASILAGLYDLNSEFDVNRAGSLFLHSAHGIGSELGLSGRNGPSIFPHTALGLRLRFLPSDRLYLQVAVLDGVPGKPGDPTGTHVALSAREGALVAWEAGLLRRGEAAPGARGTETRGGARPIRQRRVGREGATAYDTKLALSGWVYTSTQPPAGGRAEPGSTGSRIDATSWGIYLLLEAPLWRADSGDRDLHGFLRAGRASPRANRFEWYTGAGLVARGLLPGRDADEAGLAVAAAYNGATYLDARRADGPAVSRAETALELTYRLEASPWLALQLDVQGVLHPDTDPETPHAVLVGMRVVLSR